MVTIDGKYPAQINFQLYAVATFIKYDSPVWAEWTQVNIGIKN